MMKLPGQNKWTPAVCSGLVGPRRYQVETECGIFERNRKHILDTDTQPQEEDNTPISQSAHQKCLTDPFLMTRPHSHRAYQFGGHSGEDNNQTGWYNRQTDGQTDWWLPELVYVLLIIMLCYVMLCIVNLFVSFIRGEM